MPKQFFKSLLFYCWFIGSLYQVNAQSISPGTVSGSIVACVGSASANPFIQQLRVTGSSLNNDIKVTAPANFEVSLNPDNSFGNTVLVSQVGGSVNTLVYVRAAANASSGSITGNLTLTSTGAGTQLASVNALINALPTVNQVSDLPGINVGSVVPEITFSGSARSFSWTNSNPTIGLPANGTGNIPSFMATNPGSTPVTATITITPEPEDYLYIANKGSNSLSIVNTLTNDVINTLPIGVSPISPTVSSDGKYLYTASNNGSNVTVIDASTNTIKTIINLPTQPSTISQTPDGRKLYVSGNNTIHVVDVNTYTVLRSISTPASGLQIVSTDGKYLYVVNNNNTLSIINTTTDVIEATLTGFNNIKDVKISPDASRLYLVDGNNPVGHVIVFNTVTHTIVTTINVGFSPMNMSITPDGSRLYISNAFVDYVTVVNTATNTVLPNITVDIYGQGNVISPDGKFVYNVSYQKSTVSVISTANNSVVTTIALPTAPFVLGAPVISTDGSRLYVPNESGRVLYAIDTKTNTFLTTVPTGVTPRVSNYGFGKGIGCRGIPITFTITVNPAPPIVTIPLTASGTISACAGSASVDLQQISVNGANLMEGLTVTAPANFEVSLSPGSGFSSIASITQINGKADATIYVRSAATAPVGVVSGIVTIASAGAVTQTVKVAGTVSALPIINPVPDQTVNNGSIFPGVTFSGTANDFIWTNDNPLIGLPANGAGNLMPFTAVNNTGTLIKAKITVTPKPESLIYVISQNNTVVAINVAENKIVATIPVGNKPVQLVVSNDQKRVYVANYLAEGISIIDAVKNKVIGGVPVGRTGPTALTLTPDGTKLYVECGGDNKIYVVDTFHNYVTAGIPISTPSVQVCSNDGKYLYILNAFQRTISIVNTTTDIITSTISNVGDPVDIKLSPDGSKLYTFDNNNLFVTVINTSTGTKIATIPTNLPYGFLTLSADGSRLYVSGAQANTISVINTLTNTLIANLPAGNYALGNVITPDGKFIYNVNLNSHDVTVVDAATNTVIKTIVLPAVSGSLSKPIISPNGQYVFVASTNSPLVYVIDTHTNVAVNSINTPWLPTLSVKSFSSAGGCNGDPITFTITANPPPPVITATGTPNALLTTYGTASSASSFTISGTNLQAPVLVTPPVGFEVSLDNVTFSPTLKVINNGALLSTTVYIRLAKTTNAAVYSGNITLISTGATLVNVVMPQSTVQPALFVIDGNWSKYYGDALQDFTFRYDSPNINFDDHGELKNGDAFESLTVTFTDNVKATTTNAGTYAGALKTANFTGRNGFLASNYVITYNVGNVRIIPATATIQANKVIKTTGTTLSPVAASTNFTVGGMKNGETVSTVTLTYNAGASASDAPGIYQNAVRPSAAVGNFDPANYSFIYQYGDVEVLAPPPPVITISNAPSALNTIYGAASTTSTFDFTASNLTAAVAITAPPGFELSVDQISYATSVVVPSTGSLASKKIYIRLAGTTDAGSYSGNIGLTSAGVNTSIFMPLSIVSPALLTISAVNETKIYGNILAATGSSSKYAITSGSLKNGNTINSVYVVYDIGSKATDRVSVYPNMVRITDITGSNGFRIYNYSIRFTSGDIVITPAQLIISANSVKKSYGSALTNVSASTAFTANGLQNGELVSSVDITYMGGAAALAAAGSYPASVTPSKAIGNFDARNYNIDYISSELTVEPAVLTVKVDDKMREFGLDNPPFTFSYNGFVNNDNESHISVHPNLNTTATRHSPAGVYPIRAFGAIALNYTFIYVDGTLTITPTPIIILTNTFTPNGDGVNDTWDLSQLSGYKNTTVNVYNRLGQSVYKTFGSVVNWDGTYQGRMVPTGVYYYVIETQSPVKILSGSITVIR